MSKISEMIEDLCPDGVEYKFIKDVAEVGTGSSNGNEAIDDGKYPFFIRSQAVKRKNDYEYDEEAIIIPGEGGIGDIYHYVNGKYALHQRVYRIHFINFEINTKFAYYYFVSFFKTFILKKAVSATVTSIRKPMIEDFSIPVPPLEAQREIVRILDGFTELTTGLTTELTTELTLRKQQYEYYRDELLDSDFIKGFPRVKLKNIATNIFRGSGIKRDDITEEGISCVRYGEIYTTYNTYFDECVSHTKLEYISTPKWFEHGDILFAITGENVEDIAKSVAYIGDKRCIAGGDIVVMKHNQNPKYLAYALSTMDARRQKGKGKIKSKVVHSSVPSIEEIEIPLPSMAMQKRIVQILDNFDLFCNNLYSGLTNEIKARQKQYEYYRDKLLTFKEKTA